MTRKLYTKTATALTAAWFAGAALTACGSPAAQLTWEGDSQGRPAAQLTGKDRTWAAAIEAVAAYREQGCGTPTDWQAAAYAAAKTVSPQVFGADGLSDAMCADQAEALPTGGDVR